ncbi:hypothetical protein H4R34_004525 [Dimargaris verticillata]|uniref:Uncharacterized protein n=1 Tax=Dimargaris verticillata TaxID=2761393 RepID=A0A9W8AY44_9FUNG|nr:hypothetical protein H4R34_004525 [Dimargaris verticillata]
MNMQRHPSAALQLHRIVMVGAGGVGKSALTVKYISGDFVQEYDPTKADSYQKRVVLDDGPCTVDILDTAGQEEYAAIRDNYYRRRDGFLLVFSLCERDSFLEMDQLRRQIMRVLDEDVIDFGSNGASNINGGNALSIGTNGAVDIPMVLIGNKSDLADMYRQVSVEEAQELALSWNTMYIETSAKTGQGVEEAYTELLRLVNRRKLRESLANRQKLQAKAMAIKDAQAAAAAAKKDKACCLM